MINEIQRKAPEQINREHFHMEGRPELWAGLYRHAIRAAKLAAAIHGRGAHQIADLRDLIDIRLAALLQAIQDHVEHAQAFIGAAQHQFF